MSGGPILETRDLFKLLVVAGVALLVSVLAPLGVQAGLGWSTAGSIQAGFGTLSFAFSAYSLATLAALAVRKRVDSIKYFLLHSAFLVAALGFGCWLSRSYVDAEWALLAAGFVVILQAGAFVIRVYRAALFRRIYRASNDTHVGGLGSVMYDDALRGYFNEHSATYAALPVGAAITTLFGLVLHWEPRLIVINGLKLTALFTSLGVFVFLVVGAFALSRDYLRETPSVTTRVVAGHAIHSSGFWSRFRHQQEVVVHIRPVTTTDPESIGHASDGIVVAADLRKMFLLNQYQQLLVFALAASAVAHLTTGHGQLIVVLVTTGSLAVGLAQIPYVVGQVRSHAHVLDALMGVEREKQRESLRKLSPPFPSFDSWTALIGTGTAGGFAYKLLEKSLEKLLTP